MSRFSKPLLAVAALAMVAATASASIGVRLQANKWQEIVFEDKVPNRYSITKDNDILVEGDSSVSVLWRSLQQVDTDNMVLSWRWRVDEGPPATNIFKKGGDDRPISIYVSFKFDPARSTFWERSKRALVQPFVDTELPGRVLLYVWGGDKASETWIESPYFSGVGKMQVLRDSSADLSTWFQQQVNLAADHRTAFGEDPTQPYQLAISADSDDTRSTIRALIGNIMLNEQPIR